MTAKTYRKEWTFQAADPIMDLVARIILSDKFSSRLGRQTLTTTYFVPPRSTPLLITMGFIERTKRYSLVALFALVGIVVDYSPPCLLLTSLIVQKLCPSEI